MAEGSTTIITGSIGGGKTLHGVSVLMDRLSRGATCITNVVVFPDKIAEWMRAEYGIIFDPARLIQLKQASIRDFHNLAVRGTEKNSVFMLLDEAALDLNSRNWATLNAEVFNFVVLVRKLGIDLCFIAQDANDVDKQLRQKMQREIHCRSLKNMPYLGTFSLPIFVQVTYVLTVGRKPWRTGFKFVWKGPAWGYFDSKALHGAKALEFERLAQASDEALGRVEQDPWLYWGAGVGAAVGSLVGMLFL